MYKRKQRRSAFLHSRFSLSDSGSVSLELMSLELTFAGVYSCWRHGVEYILLSPLRVWQRWERNNRGCHSGTWRNVGSVTRVSPLSVSTMFLNQAHIPHQTAVIRSAGYADHDSCTAAARSDNVFFATNSPSVCRLAKSARSSHLQFKRGD